MSRSLSDCILKSSLGFAALLSGSVIVAVIAFLFHEAWPALSSGKLSHFLTDLKWQPGSDRDPQYGIAPMILASILVTLLASLIAIPLGVGGAIFQQFYAPTFLGNIHDRLLELLAGIPSVIFGFWGLTVLVPAINKWHPPGQSLLAAALVLALMILPTVGLTSRSAIRSLDPGLLQGAAALGIGRPSMILRVILPAAFQGIGSGCLLAIARAVGETLAVVMVCGNIAQIPHSVFDPVRPITSTIALEMGYASSDHRALLYASGLILVVMTGALVGWQSFRREPLTPSQKG